MTTIGTALQEATARLRSVSPTARLDAEMLLAHVLGLSRTSLIAALRDDVDQDVTRHYDDLIDRRERMEPIAYLMGEREFYGLMLAVDARVLVPRPETELLVDLALERAARYQRPDLLVADIGTGSGAIAIAIALHLPRAYVYAIDISEDALAVAAANVAYHGIADRVTLLHGDLLAALPAPVDLLLSNPPYTILNGVDAHVRQHEPHLALDGGGDDGLALIRDLLAVAPQYVRGSMLVEIGAWQGRAAADLARWMFPGKQVRVHRDLAGLDRVLDIDVTEPMDPRS